MRGCWGCRRAAGHQLCARIADEHAAACWTRSARTPTTMHAAIIAPPPPCADTHPPSPLKSAVCVLPCPPPHAPTPPAQTCTQSPSRSWCRAAPAAPRASTSPCESKGEEAGCRALGAEGAVGRAGGLPSHELPRAGRARGRAGRSMQAQAHCWACVKWCPTRERGYPARPAWGGRASGARRAAHAPPPPPPPPHPAPARAAQVDCERAAVQRGQPAVRADGRRVGPRVQRKGL